MTPDELEHLILDQLPESFLKRATSALFWAEKNAWDRCKKDFAETEAVNVRPYERRGKFEQYLRDAAEFTPGLTASVQKSDRSAWNHTEIYAGSIVLTENVVATPGALVKKAEFRATLASGNQLSLFENDDEEDEASRLFVVLIHSRSQWETRDERTHFGHLPGSLYLAVPSPDLSCYLHKMNLFERYPGIVKAHQPNDMSREAYVRYLGRSIAARYGNA